MLDLRSDTVTKPCEAMRQAMASAEVGDDVYREDPSVRRLEDRVAAVVGKPACLFVPSGTMANQIALLCHTRPGDEVISGQAAHCVFFESGAAPAWSGVQFQQVGQGGLFTAEQVRDAIKPRAYYCPNTSLVVIENTHNVSGGRVFPQPDVEAIAALARDEGLRLHLDGARVWNAAVVTERPVAELCAPFDTVSVCFSKGLGAPLGSAICGDEATIKAALRFRKMLGGGMRQAGIVAAGALFALEHNRQRLVEDHRAAQAIAAALRGIDGVSVDDVETNIIMAQVGVEAQRVVSCAEKEGVRLSAFGAHRLRLVTHLDIAAEQLEPLIDALARAVRGALRGQ